MLGLLYLLRIALPYKKLVHGYFVQSLLTSLALACIGFTIFAGIREAVLLLLIYGLFGLFQGGVCTCLLGLVSRQFTTHRDGCLLGIWSASECVGNIVGLFVCTCIIYYFKWYWIWCLFIPSLIYCFFVLLLKIFI